MYSTANYIFSLYRQGMEHAYVANLANHTNDAERHQFFKMILEEYDYWRLEQVMYDYETFLKDNRIKGE